MAERMAVNAPLQGTQADIIKLALRDVDRVLSEENMIEKCHLILQIHDELIYEVENKIIDKVIPIIKMTMEKIIPPKFLKGNKKVSIVVDVSVGPNWGEMNPVSEKSPQGD